VKQHIIEADTSDTRPQSWGVSMIHVSCIRI